MSVEVRARGAAGARAALRTCHVLSGYDAERPSRIMVAISLSFMQSRRDDSANETAFSIISFCIAPMFTTAGPTRKRGGMATRTYAQRPYTGGLAHSGGARALCVHSRLRV